jgi:excinuclease ABC subunit C
MEEVLTRRFRRYLQDRDEGARSGKRFAYPPNLVLIDGGKGQLGVAVRVMEELGLEDIAVASLAKRFEEVYVPGQPDPVRIPRDSEALYLLQQIRDEAHRFAITYHRQLRGKTMTKSVLDDVPGLGPTRKKRLLKEHGSVKRLRALTEDELVAISWLPDTVAHALYAKLHGESVRT